MSNTIQVDLAACPSDYTAKIGPNHPALKEPVQFTFKLHGEKIVDVDFEPGQAHRGIEWMGMRRNPIQIIYLAERICGICGVTHSFAFCRAMEQVLGLQVPPRAHYVRTIVAELERLHSHLLWAGVAAHELGFDSLFFLTWQIREKVMDLLELITGNRVNYGIMQVGGVNRDVTDEQIPVIREALKYFEENLDKLKMLFLEDTTIQMRCRDCGVLSRKDALELCPVGPTARASGINKDVRQDHPYGAYADMDIKAVLPDELTGEIRGDVYDRIVVRVLEIPQSLEIIRFCLDNMPDGALLAEPKIAKLLNMMKKVKGEGFGQHEAPRGEATHYVRMDAAEAPASWKVKASSYSNYMSWIPMLKGEQIADIPIIVASIDPCISCTDRVAVVNQGSARVYTKQDLHRMSVEKTRRMQRG